MEKDDQNKDSDNRKYLSRQNAFQRQSHEEKEPQKQSDDEEKKQNRIKQIGVGDEKEEP